MNASIPVDGSCRKQTPSKIKPPNQDQEKKNTFEDFKPHVLSGNPNCLTPYYKSICHITHWCVCVLVYTYPLFFICGISSSSGKLYERIWIAVAMRRGNESGVYCHQQMNHGKHWTFTSAAAIRELPFKQVLNKCTTQLTSIADSQLSDRTDRLNNTHHHPSGCVAWHKPALGESSQSFPKNSIPDL